MNMDSTTESKFATGAWAYLNRLQGCFTQTNLAAIEKMAEALRQAWIEGRQVYICGNGGSAANAIHMANDLHYGIGDWSPGTRVTGLRVEALPANTGVITCLANDTGYENIYAHQIEVKGRKGDLLIVLSGSGNSSNVVRALETSNEIGMCSYAILGFNGGRCRELADTAIHFEINDMQVAEDTQLIVGHLCMQWLRNAKPCELRTRR